MTMPAGKYWIGDLCYVLEDEWDEACDLMFSNRDGNGGEGEFTMKDGRKFAVFSTKWGDGCYLDQEGRQYGVDAGSIGCILAKDLTYPGSVPEGPSSGGNIVDIPEDFEPKGSRKDGIIQFGPVIIETA